VEQCLVPTLKRGDIVVADNVSFHKVAGVEEAIRGVGASLRYLPQYSPDLNPIELVFHPAKTFLRKAAERTIEGLHRCVRSFIRTIDPSECMNYFRHAGYEPLWPVRAVGALVLTSTLVLVRAVLPGVGGSLGFAAFVTVAILVALNRAAAHWQPNPQSEPRTSSNLNTLARLGAAIANGGVATFVVASLLHGNAVLPDRRAEDVSDPMGVTVTERAAPQLVIADATSHQVDDLTPLGVSVVNADDADAVILSSLPRVGALRTVVGRRLVDGIFL
jgi:transposase